MSNITTDLIDWGKAGTLWNPGYAWADGKGVADAWENKFRHETIRLLKDEVLPTVNARMESSVATADPGAPETGQLTFRSDTSRLRLYDGTSQKTLAWKSEVDSHAGSTSNPHTVTLEQARAAGNGVSGDINVTGGTVNIGGNPVATQTYVDSAEANVTVSEDGVSVGTATSLNFKDHLNVSLVGGVLDIDADHNHDTRYYTQAEVDSKAADGPNKESYLETRIADPTNPDVGRIWLRTD